jgi:hypothetical protein
MLYMQARAGRGLLALLVSLAGAPASAQVPPPPTAAAAPDDTPRLRVGATLFADFTLTLSPDGTDEAGQPFKPNAFNVGRAYINLTGQVHHLVSFRITPDIRPETGAGSTLRGSYSFQLKYAYAQLNLDDWLPQGTWVRLGMQPVPYTDYLESVYRYRFQGPLFVDREGFIATSDAAFSFRAPFGGEHGDVHVGVFNGETFRQFERNDQKALMVRGTWRPLPRSTTLGGLRVTGFFDHDAYMADTIRRRLVGDVSFTHPRVHAGALVLDATDQVLPTSAEVDTRGFPCGPRRARRGALRGSSGSTGWRRI